MNLLVRRNLSGSVSYTHLDVYKRQAIISYTPSIVVALMCITSIIMILARVFKPNFICKNQMLSSLFLPKPFEFILSIIGSLLGVVVLFQLFSEKIYSEDTGGTILELVANIMVWFIVALSLIHI